MAERTTEAQVIAAFDYLKKAAESAGIKGADRWVLQHGNGSYGYHWRVVSNAGFKKGRDLGSTKREAREAMLHMAEGLWLASPQGRANHSE
jgi:hypothetical protein